MKKIVYYIVVSFLSLFSIFGLLINRTKWNNFGEKIDKYFGVDSRYTKQKKIRQIKEQ